MPYNFTHALVGLAAQQKLRAPLSSLIAENSGAFLIGTMGPDPYFGDAMPRPLFSRCRVDLAEKLHSLDMRTLFAAAIPLVGDSAVKHAYILGFLCHFLLDTNAHPYIEARFAGAAHTPSEIQMDLMMTDRSGLINIPQPPRRFYRTAHLAELDELHAALAHSLFGDNKRARKGVFARSFRKWIAVNTLSYDPNNRKLRFFGWLEKVFHMKGKLTGYLVSHHPDPQDRLNLSHAVWCAPWEADVPRTESFVELFERACAEAPDVLSAAYRAMQGDNIDEALALIGARRMDARPV